MTCDAETELDRIRKRARAEESFINLDFLDSLNKALHKEVVKIQNTTPVITIDSGKKDFANVTRIIDKLAKLGYVCKKKSKKDNRISNVYILPKAEEIRAKIENCWKESSAIALEGVSKTEQETLLNILDKIESNVLGNLE